MLALLKPPKLTTNLPQQNTSRKWSYRLFTLGIFARNIVLSGFFITALAHLDVAAETTYPEVEVLRKLLAQADQDINFAKAKLTIDQLVDPNLNSEAAKERIQSIVEAVNRIASKKAKFREITATDKMLALRTFLYKSGEWNQYRPYGYDLNDPLGHDINNKLLANYLDSRKGNCISMPILFVVLGQQLGLNVRLSTAPLHSFVKFTDENGRTFNLEATSGANPARDVYFQEQFNITPTAIENGIYLQTLSKKESLAVIASVVLEKAFEGQQYKKTAQIADVILEHYPKYVYAMIKKASAYFFIMKEEYIDKYPRVIDIPLHERSYYRFLDNENYALFSKAEALGWREPSLEQETQYLQVIKQQQNKGTD